MPASVLSGKTKALQWGYRTRCPHLEHASELGTKHPSELCVDGLSTPQESSTVQALQGGGVTTPCTRSQGGSGTASAHTDSS
jgi:hypothetical protein